MTDPSQTLVGLSLAEKRMLLAELLQEKAKQGQSLYPLSHGQRGLWFLYQMDRNDAAYNVYFPSRIRSRLDLSAFRRFVQVLIDRHPCLRTTFEERNGELLQRVHDKMPAAFQAIDASSWSEQTLHARVEEEAHRPFDLEQGPLLRLYLFSRSPEDHIFLLTAHHIIGDFWSLVVILEEMLAIYPALCMGAVPTLPPLKNHYRDFVRWQAEMLAGPEGMRLWSYWEKQLAGVPPALELPTDRPRPPRFTHHGDTYPCRLGPELTARLEALAVREQVTLYTVLLAGFQVLLGRYSGQDDFVVGTPFAGRGRPGFEKVVGYFINMVPLRANLAGDPPFRTLLHQVGSTVLDALQHQDYPFPLLIERLKVKRDLSRTPLAQVTFTIEKARLSGSVGAWRFSGPQAGNGSGERVAGLQVEPCNLSHRTCQTDLELVLEEGDGIVEGVVQYNTDLFDAQTMARLVGHFQTLLAGAAADPSRRLSELPWLTGAERRQLLYDWNDTRKDYPRDLCLHHLFEQQVQRAPEAIAVRCGEDTLSYAGLDAWANRIARQLRQASPPSPRRDGRLGCPVASTTGEPPVATASQQAGPLRPEGEGTLVALCLQHSPEMLAAILGVLKAGAAYVPLDPDSPDDRLRIILADTRPVVLITQPSLAARLSAVASCRLLVVGEDEKEESSSSLPTANCQSATARDIAYVIYTSGSTGQPKGVMVEHGAIVNTVFWHVEALEMRADDRLLLILPYFFDASVCVIFPALAVGAQIVLAKPGEERDPSSLRKRIARDEVTILATVPGMLRLLLDGPMQGAGRTLRLLYCGGEPLPAELLARTFEQLKVPFRNLYGPTEVAVDATCWIARHSEKIPVVPPIGRPIHNVQVYVLDSHRRPVPVGVPGELYVGGAGLARGYLNDPQLTAERFIANPFHKGEATSARLYRTGDRCRWLPDGNLEFLGRLDQQVKVRGYRIELGEIEATLKSALGVQEAAVIVSDGIGGQRLIACVVPFSQEELEDREATIALLRRHLKDKLPAYMMPASFVLLPSLPRTPSGKVDRKALQESHPSAGSPERVVAGRPAIAPATALEEFLAKLWSELLHVEHVSVEDNFFELGGNSIQAALVIGRLQERLSEHVTTVAIFDSPTIAGLVRHLAGTCPEAVRRVFGPESLDRHRAANGVPTPVTPGSSLLVPLQPHGSLAPCFMVHPPGGIVVCYQSLAQQMGQDRPFYGIRARGLHGEQGLPTRLEEMAAEYVSAIRQVQPEGPYHLGGWSMGGVVAFEMAQLLLAQGQQVGLLALLDTTIPFNEANKDYLEEDEDTGREYGLDITLEELDLMGPDEQLPYLLQHVQRLGLLDIETPWPVVEQILNDLKRLFHAHAMLANDYSVRPYPGRITLIRPTELPVAIPMREDRGWGLLAESVEVHFVPGHHHSMVKDPHVQVLAQRLRLCLQQAEKAAEDLAAAVKQNGQRPCPSGKG